MSIYIKAKNLVPVLVNTLRKMLQGKNILANPEIAITRIKICESCDQLLGNSRSKYICKICECRIRYKARLFYSNCPINKWPTS